MRRTIEEHHIRTLQKFGGGSSYFVTLPIDVVRRLKWREGQKVEVRQSGKGITINDWKKN